MTCCTLSINSNSKEKEVSELGTQCLILEIFSCAIMADSSETPNVQSILSKLTGHSISQIAESSLFSQAKDETHQGLCGADASSSTAAWKGKKEKGKVVSGIFISQCA